MGWWIALLNMVEWDKCLGAAMIGAMFRAVSRNGMESQGQFNIVDWHALLQLGLGENRRGGIAQGWGCRVWEPGAGMSGVRWD